MAVYVAHRLVSRYIPPGKKDKDGRAIKFKSGDSQYRIYLPQRADISYLLHGGRQIIYTMDHIKGFGTGDFFAGGDKHASVLAKFNGDGHLTGIDINMPDGPNIKIPFHIKKGSLTVGAEIPFSEIAKAITRSAGDNHFKHVILNSLRHLDYAVIKRLRRRR